MMLRNVLSNWVALATNAIISMLIMPFMIHELGAFYYGLWILVGSLVDYYGLLDAGMRTTVQRFVARHSGASDREALDETFTTGLALAGLMAAVVLVLSAAIAISPFEFGLGLGGYDLGLFRSLMLCLGASVALSLPARLLGSYLCGLQRFDLYNAGSIATTIVRALLIVALLRTGHGVLGVAFATLSTMVLLLALNAWLLRRVDSAVKFRWRHVSLGRAWELFSFSIYIFVFTVGSYLRNYTSSIVIAKMLGIAFVTPFSVATRLMEYVRETIIGVLGPLMARMSALDGQNKRDELQQTFFRATRMTALLTSFLGWVMVLGGDALIRFWLGDGFGQVNTLLLVLLAGSMLALAQSPAAVLLVACGRPRPIAMWTIAEGVANVLFSIWGAATFGLIGVAVGMAIPALVCRAVVQPWYALKAFDIPVRRYLSEGLARPALVNVAFVAVVMFTHVLAPRATGWQLAFALTCQIAVFGMLAASLGCSAAARQTLWSHARRVAGFVGGFA
jgi:O-antigen/teichoic acid export membrane protein